MKTALQELIEFMELPRTECADAYKKVHELLSKEKEQIIGGFNDGQTDMLRGYKSNPVKFQGGEDYYNKIFK